ARLLFEGLGTLRPALLQTLLEKCTSVKVKRLFLHLAELQRHPWLRELDQSRISLGRGKRVLVAGGRLDPKFLITVPAVVTVPADAP
ncbi:MAG: type IV toxin-antitoxin system AbiEi family antitoxin domain-containing protein, partial [Lacunisphaera sp.]|nr:type IV toxin-antitoxin system AbiEi family antitoxin domain-containing protein [Lacunisphaera sp.]